MSFFSYTEVLGRMTAINQYLYKIKLGVDYINEPNTLDRILALLIKADASITVSDSNIQQKFEKKDHFAPRQKNETQLLFTKTADNYHWKYMPLRYTILRTYGYPVANYISRLYMSIITWYHHLVYIFYQLNVCV